MPGRVNGSKVNIDIEEVSEIKYLGVIIDRKLKWSRHSQKRQGKNAKRSQFYKEL